MRNYITTLLLIVSCLGIISCSSDMTDDAAVMKDGKYVYAMQFNGYAPGYNDDVASRATSKNWASGAVVYLRITSGSNTILGTATYDGTAWTLKTDASLSGSGTCTAVCIENPTSTTSTTVNMAGLSAIYTGSGNYSLSGTTLTLTASLTPKYGRIRLKGTSGTSVSLTGLKICTAYNISTGAFTTATNAVSTSIQSTGYTPYIYGELSGTTLSTNGYTMTCPTTMMKAGESGWVNYPTSSSHTGWVAQ